MTVHEHSPEITNAAVLGNGENFRSKRSYYPCQRQTRVVCRNYQLVAFGISAALRFILVLAAVTWPLIFNESSILLSARAAIPLIVFAMSFAALTITAARLEGSPHIGHPSSTDGMPLALAAIVALPAAFFDHSVTPKSLYILLEAALGGLVALQAAALLARVILQLVHRSLVHRVLVVGDGPSARDVAARLTQDSIVELVGTFPIGTRISKGALAETCQLRAVDVAIVVVPWGADGYLQAVADELYQLPIDVGVYPDFSQLGQKPTSISTLGGLPLLGIADRPLEGWSFFLKRAEDLLLGLLLLVASLPLALLIAICIKLDSPGPVLFRQPRVGYRNQLFEILKFRTMHREAADVKATRLVSPNDSRVTRVGAFLRRMSLDELPQLINVIKGDMSLVGPRPHALQAKAGNVLYPEAVEHYAARFRIRPGITGWAQVNGWRGPTDTLDEIRGRLEHDLYYINNWSMRLDLTILLKTPRAVLSRRNAV
jgi:Undecaprenyl-phosphate glucose phosphotransferase